mmetsp:Transcript_7720/g.16103  ORF Transcript_7720/g.16103 Transcript_7720/m.16103 type:complete len:214 (-) Transcript_7720:1246-1887(-)
MHASTSFTPLPPRNPKLTLTAQMLLPLGPEGGLGLLGLDELLALPLFVLLCDDGSVGAPPPRLGVRNQSPDSEVNLLADFGACADFLGALVKLLLGQGAKVNSVQSVQELGWLGEVRVSLPKVLQDLGLVPQRWIIYIDLQGLGGGGNRGEPKRRRVLQSVSCMGHVKGERRAGRDDDGAAETSAPDVEHVLHEEGQLGPPVGHVDLSSEAGR